MTEFHLYMRLEYNAIISVIKQLTQFKKKERKKSVIKYDKIDLKQWSCHFDIIQLKIEYKKTRRKKNVHKMFPGRANGEYVAQFQFQFDVMKNMDKLYQKRERIKKNYAI